MSEIMYDRIKRMSKEEMREFIYLVYYSGNKDGREYFCDDFHESSYFGGTMLGKEAKEIMPNDKVDDLWNTWELNR